MKKSQKLKTQEYNANIIKIVEKILPNYWNNTKILNNVKRSLEELVFPISLYRVYIIESIL